MMSDFRNTPIALLQTSCCHRPTNGAGWRSFKTRCQQVIGYLVENVPLQPSDLRAFVPGLDAEQVIETYAVLGGMPRNLLALDPQRSLMRNIEREILDPAGNLFSEVRLLLHEELKGEVDAFSRVLEAIAAGNHQRQEIAAAANLTLASAQHYLNDLVTNGLVEHRLPLNRVRDEGRSGTYHILDPFLRFWHRWAAPIGCFWRSVNARPRRRAKSATTCRTSSRRCGKLWRASTC